MFCRGCGNELTEDAQYCPACGTKVHQASEAIKTTNEASSENTESESYAEPEFDVAVSEIISETPSLKKATPHVELPASTRWLIFGIACVVVLAIGLVPPLVTVLTNENSVLSGNLNTSVEENTSTDVSADSASSDDSSSMATNSSMVSSQSSSTSTTSTENAEGKDSAVSDEEDYILPDIASRLYSTEELNELTDQELYFARNEIFARYGREFQNSDLIEYFSSKDWYNPKYSPADFDSMPSPLNQYEHDNLDAIRALESQRNSPYAV